MAFAARASLIRSRARASETTRWALRADAVSVKGRTPESLAPPERLAHCIRFFDAHSGLPVKPPGRYGFGQGMVDFLTWELASGRLDDDGGPTWWRVVSGLLILDLCAAQTALAHDPGGNPEPAVAAWLEYARFASRFRLERSHLARGQRLFWEAHQLSLYRGIERAEPFYPKLPETERRFIDEVVLHNVNYAALSNDVTYLDTVGLFGFLVYPANYPASEWDVERARSLRIDRIPLSASHRRSYDDVGRHSTRWRDASAVLTLNNGAVA